MEKQLPRALRVELCEAIFARKIHVISSSQKTPLLAHFLMETVHDDLSSAALEVEEGGNETHGRSGRLIEQSVPEL